MAGEEGALWLVPLPLFGLEEEVDWRPPCLATRVLRSGRPCWMSWPWRRCRRSPSTRKSWEQCVRHEKEVLGVRARYERELRELRRQEAAGGAAWADP